MFARLPKWLSAGVFVGVWTLAALLACLAARAEAQSPTAFRLADRELVPEGIAYDGRTQTFYVGSTYLRKIVSVDARGGVARDFTGEAQDGLTGVLGMRVDARRGVLWAVSSHAGLSMPMKGMTRECLGCSGVFKYDLRDGRLIKKYHLPNAPAQHFLNDLTINSAGDVFITDTVGGALYTVNRRRDELELFLSLGPRAYPNGIDLSGDGRRLFVAVDGGLSVVEVRSKQVSQLRLPAGVKPGIDGLYFHRNTLVAIQPFDAHKVVRYRLDKRQEAVTSVEVLEADHPLMSQPTTGVVAGREFYYIANSQLQLFRAAYQPGAEIDRGKLSAYVVLRLKL